MIIYFQNILHLVLGGKYGGKVHVDMNGMTQSIIVPVVETALNAGIKKQVEHGKENVIRGS